MSMKALFLLALCAVACGADARAEPRTVCTITVNSADEKEAFRRHLPAGQYRFVELVERGRPDWLASACRQEIRCDLLVISGHFDGSTVFYSDQLDVGEHLPVEEMERVACSDACPGLFKPLKEVYLFGCNTLNPEAIRFPSPEVGRSLVRAGYSPADAARRARLLDQRHGESSRDRMRRIFRNVPVIYGFSSTAPLGPTAANRLGRYFQTAPAAEVGDGRPSPRLLGQFAADSMTVVTGIDDAEAHAVYRREVCQFLDDRRSPAAKLRFVHEILGREMAEVRMYFERIEKLFASFGDGERSTPEFVEALGEIARDDVARERYLRFAADADHAVIRARMIGLAGTLGWLSPAGERAELARMIGDLLARKSVNAADVNLVCTLNEDRKLDPERDHLPRSPGGAGNVSHAAVLACLGSADGRARMLAALAGDDEDDVEIARVYLAHRPITDVDELRAVVRAIARMTRAGAQAHALEALARQRLWDRESLEVLSGLFAATPSVEVQRAVAAVLIRADVELLAAPEVVRTLNRHRLKSSGSDDVIDVLIRRLQASAASAPSGGIMAAPDRL
jgi:hypothetical protein